MPLSRFPRLLWSPVADRHHDDLPATETGNRELLELETGNWHLETGNFSLHPACVNRTHPLIIGLTAVRLAA